MLTVLFKYGKKEDNRKGKPGEFRRCKAIGTVAWQPLVNEKVGSALWLVLSLLM
jgi:hypothetical protein